MNMKMIPRCLAVVTLVSPLRAGVELSKVFTPHMVLQRGMTVPVYGTAAPGEKVSVKFRGQSKSAAADQEGKWLVKLDAMEAGGQDVLTIGDRQIEDVLVGEVWIGSGQSNMDMPVSAYAGGDPVLAEAAKATYPKIRLMKKGANDPWQEATPENIAGFSALLFSFGFPLQKELDVPVGLMVGAVGGTPSGFWLSEEMYRSDAACAAAVKKFVSGPDYEALVAKYNEAKEKVRIMKHPNTHMVTSSDLGPGVHPVNKSGYGARAGEVALATAYARDNEWLGPLYASHSVAGGGITLRFTHTGKGLTFKNGGALQGFMIAGEDGKFVWADARIEGDTVVVSSATVPKPAAVRYAWSDKFPWANLFNLDGLPAQPFRTDS